MYCRLALAILLVATVSVSGCNPPANTPAPAAPAIEVSIGGRPEFDAMLAKHRGEVVLVDFWALWCGPCTENFPHTVALADKYRAQGLATIGVSLDDPDSKADVAKFLASHGANFDHLLAKDGASSATMDAFELNAAVPHYRLYDRTGKSRHQWDGLPDDLEQQIQALLAESK